MAQTATALPAFETWTPASLTDWAPAAFPDSAGGAWTWAEPEASVQVLDGHLAVEVPRFTRSHDSVQIFDNPKHLLACARQIPVPDQGVRIETTISGALLGAEPTEWGTGFASFNLMDFDHGLVLDGLANGGRTAALFERLAIPGTPPRQAFTTIADGPASAPDRMHALRFEYRPAQARLQAWIDGSPVLDQRGVPERIRAFTPGFGLITLEPIRDGRSTSLRGQGCRGRLGPIHVTPL